MGRTFIAERIHMQGRSNEAVTILINGEIGAGKTAYALYTARCIYSSWDEVLAHLYFDPRPLVEEIKEAHKRGERIPLIIVDDAGLWLSKLSWWERPIREFMEFFNVIRSVCGAVIFTTPSNDIPQRIIEKIQYHVLVRKINKKNARGVPLSQAVIYRSWMTPAGRRIKKVAIDIYPRHYPNPVFIKYEDMRRQAIARKLDSVLRSLEDKRPSITRREAIREVYNLMKEKRIGRDEAHSILAEAGMSYYARYKLIRKIERAISEGLPLELILRGRGRKRASG